MRIFEPGDVFADRFRLEERIGQGGMGQVWRARQLGLNREVALKLILPTVDDDASFRSMFEAEAQISAQLSHPNIVPVVDSGDAQGVLWLVQVFVRGRDLSKVLQEYSTGISLPAALFVTTELLQALQAAHEHGVIHRDLKPSNVLVSNMGEVLLTDFGISKVVQPNQVASVSTILKCSPGYSAPEILRGQPPCFGSDLFSVGVLLWELLVGRNPFIGPHADREQVFHATINNPVPWLGQVGAATLPGLDEFLQYLLAKEPSGRYATASLALDCLRAVSAPVAREATAATMRQLLERLPGGAPAIQPVAVEASSGRGSLRVSGMAGQVRNGSLATRASQPVKMPRRRGYVAATLTFAGAAIAVLTISVMRSSSGEPATGAGAAKPAMAPVAPEAAASASAATTLSPTAVERELTVRTVTQDAGVHIPEANASAPSMGPAPGPATPSTPQHAPSLSGHRRTSGQPSNTAKRGTPSEQPAPAKRPTDKDSTFNI